MSVSGVNTTAAVIATATGGNASPIAMAKPPAQSPIAVAQLAKEGSVGTRINTSA